jgi:hypothetical protein
VGRGRISSAVLVQLKGWQRSVPALDEGADGGDEPLDAVNEPRRIAWRVMIPKNTSK